MKTDLKNTTFIVPLRIDTGDRLRNVILTTSYLLHHFNTNVIINNDDFNSNIVNVTINKKTTDINCYRNLTSNSPQLITKTLYEQINHLLHILEHLEVLFL